MPTTLVLINRIPKTALTVTLLILSTIFPGAALAIEPLLPSQFTQQGSLHIPIEIKEVAGTGVSKYPVDIVVPLPAHRYHDPSLFRLVDESNITIPAQFKVLTRWTDAENSIRHLHVHSIVSLPPFTGPGTGKLLLYLKDDGEIRAQQSLTIQDTPTHYIISTGPLKFTVHKYSFNVLDSAWLDINNNGVFEHNEQYVVPTNTSGAELLSHLGATVRDIERLDVKVTLEEVGPQRVCIKAEALTKQGPSTGPSHGFAVRIYAYSGLSILRIGYQLQNSSKERMFSWPLYFYSLNLNLPLTLGKDKARVRVGMGSTGSVFEQELKNGIYLAQESHNAFTVRASDSKLQQTQGIRPDGYLDIHDGQRGITAAVRYFAETWPNGIEALPSPSESGSLLRLQLFPEWSAQLYNGELSPTGLYWLNDMQHVLKEVLISFYAGPFDHLRSKSLAQTFSLHPVSTLSAEWHRFATGSLPLGGILPAGSIPPSDIRTPKHLPLLSSTVSTSAASYPFGWENFGEPEPGYRDISCTTGGYPYSKGRYFVSGDPRDYFDAEITALAELNRRPQWMAGYKHDSDWNRLKLTDNPYCGSTWRAFLGGSTLPYEAPWLLGTGRKSGSRDNAHGWFYHLEEAYYMSGNPWIRDWYEFIAEFRRTTLERLDPYPDRSGRAQAHALNNAMQAYRVTGKASVLEGIGKYIQTYLRKEQDRFYGDLAGDPLNGFMTGYLANSIVNYLEEVKTTDAQGWATAFSYLSGLMEWNYNWGNYAYHWDVRAKKAAAPSSGTSSIFGDPVAWYYWHTGNRKYLDHLSTYIQTGINGGARPYTNLQSWAGTFEGRWSTYALNAQRAPLTPPNRITDLKAIQQSDGVKLEWTTPDRASRIHIVWSDKPITGESTTNTDSINWWAANVLGLKASVLPSEKQSVVIPSTTQTTYAAVFTFDSAWNLSEMSNVASTNASCTFSLIPPMVAIGASPGAHSFLLNNPGRCPFEHSTNSPWVTSVAIVDSADTNQASDYTTIRYEVSGNSSANSRSGAIHIAGLTMVITQAGATPTFELKPSSLNVDSAAGAGVASVTASVSDAPWAAISNSPSWLKVLTPGGVGSGEIRFSFDANSTNSSRTGLVQVGGQQLLVNQAARTAIPIEKPVASEVSPGHGGGSVGTFTFRFKAPLDYQNISIVNVLLNGGLDGRNSCYLAFVLQTNVLYLVDDAGTRLLPGIALGATATSGNSQCMVFGDESSVSGQGDTLTLMLKMSFSSSFSGSKIWYLAARDREGRSSDWTPLGIWKVPGNKAEPFEIHTSTPGRGLGSGKEVRFRFSHDSGWGGLEIVNVLLNQRLDGRSACYLAYVRATNILYLVNDEGTQLLPALAVNQGGSVSNGQCTVSNPKMSGSGFDMELSMHVQFSAQFKGNHVWYAALRDAQGRASQWVPVGSWGVD